MFASRWPLPLVEAAKHSHLPLYLFPRESGRGRPLPNFPEIALRMPPSTARLSPPPIIAIDITPTVPARSFVDMAPAVSPVMPVPMLTAVPTHEKPQAPKPSRTTAIPIHMTILPHVLRGDRFALRDLWVAGVIRRQPSLFRFVKGCHACMTAVSRARVSSLPWV